MTQQGEDEEKGYALINSVTEPDSTLQGQDQRTCAMIIILFNDCLIHFYHVYLAGTMHNKNISLNALRNDVAPDLANSYFPAVVPGQVKMDTLYTKQAT